MDDKKKAMVKLIIGLLAVFLIGFIGLSLYQSSMNNDFNNISTTEIERVGDTYTGLYHRPDCPKAKTIVNPVYFNEGTTAAENNKKAEKEGYVPCKRCKPNE
ncbi:MAG: hypothetical protein K6C05_01120 [Anaerovibrio sp.]|uniref:Ada metal-binding domain-containing protein n=1 Tax=Anaerovibrio sp. TaxID=1872532 RepID=UPI0025D3D3FE|nr:Ada metal-binding domain-containing protein [Anaerovibrio sp.]MCR5175431.1 hypothetical protein [Anaerovibrio sp.]